MKTALSLAGGGAKGSYEIGAYRALQELGYNFDIITGTSIGALNGFMLVQGDADKAIELWQTINADKVFSVSGLDMNEIYDINIDYILDNREMLLPLVKKYISEKGADITPFKKLLHQYVDEEKFFKSKIDFGLMTVRFPSFVPLEVRKTDIAPTYLEKWVLASASCFPAFPVCEIDGEKYIDGMYYDNLPVSTAVRMGAEKVIAVALKPGVSQTKYTNSPIVTYIEPSRSLGTALSFRQETLLKNLQSGYFDAMKTLGTYYGNVYTFKHGGEKELSEIGARIFSMISKLEAEGKPELQLAAKPGANNSEICEFLNSITAPSRKSKINTYCAVLECCMAMLEYDCFQLYDMKEVLKELPEHMKQHTNNTIASVEAISREISNSTDFDKVIKRTKPENLIYALTLDAFGKA